MSLVQSYGSGAVGSDGPAAPSAPALVQTFATGATRSAADGKHEYARYMDPLVIREFGAYMTRHRAQPDGAMRAPDNWKKGITRQSYMDGLWRHVEDLWLVHCYPDVQFFRPEDGKPITIKDTLCAIMFNSMGFLFEVLRAELPVAAKPPLPGSNEREAVRDGVRHT